MGLIDRYFQGDNNPIDRRVDPSGSMRGYITGENGQFGKLTRRVDQLYSRTKQKNAANLTKDGSGPTPPLNATLAVGGGSSISFSFLPMNDPRLAGYMIYRSLENNQATALRIGFIAKPTNFGAPITFTDQPRGTGTYYYWVSAASLGGSESAKIGMGVATISIPGYPPLDLTSAYWYDDFLSGTDGVIVSGGSTVNDTTKYGSISNGWAFNCSSDAHANIKFGGFGPDNPGWLNIYAGQPYPRAASNDTASLYLPNTGDPSNIYPFMCHFQPDFTVRFLLKVNASNFGGSSQYQFGLYNSSSTYTKDEDGLFFYYSTADANWRAIWRYMGSTITNADLGVAPTDNFTLFKIRHEKDLDFYWFSVENSDNAYPEVRVNTNFLGNFGFTPWFPMMLAYCESGDTYPVSITADFFDVYVRNITRIN